MASSPTEMAIFERVAERGSFAGAAEGVSLSPSAVAKLITRLEQRLGVRLINRTTRRLALTAEGEIYLGGQCQAPCRPIDQPHAEALLQSRDELCHGGWRQAYALGCARKAAALRHAFENGHLGW